MGTSAIAVQQESKQGDARSTLYSSSNVIVILDAVRSTARGEVSLARLRTKHRQAQIFVLTVESCSLGRWKQTNRRCSCQRRRHSEGKCYKYVAKKACQNADLD